MKYSTRNQ